MPSSPRPALLPLLFLCALAFDAMAHFGPIPLSLKGVPVPPVPGLVDGPDPIIVDPAKAIVLGKALFWDMNVGSDGMACASCHFHAGADSRTVNQVAPGGGETITAQAYFESLPDGRSAGPNQTLRRADFPLHRTTDPLSPDGVVVHSTDDVVGSAGAFGGSFREAAWLEQGDDDCLRAADPVYHRGAIGTRRVESRNTPTVINAVFNHRQFWDGRANNVFNGSSAWGDRDPQAGVWIDTGTGLVKERLHLINSSLASQAISPPENAVEMSCAGRRFADLGRKLMWRRPLERQLVAHDDSVLGPHARSTPGTPRTGLNIYYYNLVREAFNPKYWRSTVRGGGFGAPPQFGRRKPLAYDQFEANFALFFALAIQMYESTLVSDDAPYDRSAVGLDGVPTELSEDALAGLDQFRTAHCSLCHLGPTLTSAALVTNAEMATARPEVFGNSVFAISTSRNVITRLAVQHDDGQGGLFSAAALIDTGFASNGVIRAEWDRGLGGTDPFGNPLSFARQYLDWLTGNAAAVVDAAVFEIRPCDFDTPLAYNFAFNHPQIFTQVDGVQAQGQSSAGCFNPLGAYLPTPAAAATEAANPATRKMRVGVDGAFKIPSLRNITLTGPYMHNGSLANLEEVVEFYTRGGNFQTASKHFGFVFPQDELRFEAAARAQIVAFLETLTDERVRFERAPFDHPALRVPHGHVGDAVGVVGGHPLAPALAQDRFFDIPAVGAGGRSTPLPSFEELLPP